MADRPESRPKSSWFRKVSIKLKHHEPIFLVVGVVASSLSALAACVAAYLTMQQLAVLEEEKRTSYELSALAERRAAVRDVLRAAAEYEITASCYVSRVTSERAGRPVDFARFRECETMVRSKVENYMMITRANIVSLPLEYQAKVLRYGDAAGMFNLCEFDRLLIQSPSAPTDIVSFYKNNCLASTDESYRELQRLSVDMTQEGIRIAEGLPIEPEMKKAGSKANSTAPNGVVAASPPTGATPRPLVPLRPAR